MVVLTDEDLGQNLVKQVYISMVFAIFCVDLMIPNVPLKMEARYYQLKCAKIVQIHIPNHQIFTTALDIFPEISDNNETHRYLKCKHLKLFQGDPLLAPL